MLVFNPSSRSGPRVLRSCGEPRRFLYPLCPLWSTLEIFMLIFKPVAPKQQGSACLRRALKIYNPREVLGLEGRAADKRAVYVRLGHQAVYVVGVDGAGGYYPGLLRLGELEKV